MAKRIYKKTCVECEGRFEATFSAAKYCCPECKYRGNLKRQEEYRQRKAEEKVQKSIKGMTIADINAAARKVGMNYGQYVALHNL